MTTNSSSPNAGSPTQELPQAGETLPVLTFTLGEQHYALLIENVVEVASMVELMSVADPRPEILGIANLHGTALPIIDLRRIMRHPAPQVDASTLFVVVTCDDEMFGVVVGEIQQVEYVPASQIQKSTATGEYIRGIISHKQRLIQLIALAPLLSAYRSDAVTEDWL